MKLEKITEQDIERFHLKPIRRGHNDWELFGNESIKTVLRYQVNGDYEVGFFDIEKPYQLKLYEMSYWDKLNNKK